jgi:hypothetical protein
MKERLEASMELRAETLEALLDAGRRLQLNPEDDETRATLATRLASLRLAAEDRDTLFVAALIKEATAHADELSFRLEAPGYPALYIASIAARLCQTLITLRRQLLSRSSVTA